MMNGAGLDTRQIIVLVQTLFTIFLPCLITWLAIGALLYQRKNFQIRAKKILFMYSAVVLTVTLSWFFEELSAFVQRYAIPDSESNVRHYARMLALCTPCIIPCICFTMCKELRQQVKLIYASCGNAGEDENSTTNNPREDCVRSTEHEIPVVLIEPEDEIKDTMKKQYSFERENTLNQEKDEDEHQTLALQQLSVRRDSSNEIMAAERSPSAVRYVKHGEMTTIALIW